MYGTDEGSRIRYRNSILCTLRWDQDGSDDRLVVIESLLIVRFDESYLLKLIEGC